MNRSFHKSQPLRSADCNAVEVKSKVSVKVWGAKLLLIMAIRTAYPAFGAIVRQLSWNSG